jgi:hypothetical protein
LRDDAIPDVLTRGANVWRTVQDFDSLDAKLWIESERRMAPALFETSPPAPAPQPTRPRNVLERLAEAHAASAAQREAQRQPEQRLTEAQITALNSIRNPTERMTKARELQKRAKRTEG